MSHYSINLNESGNNIYATITKFPGIHFRELMRRCKVANGHLSYYLYSLEKHKLIESEKVHGYLAIYPKGLEKDEKIIVFHLRRDVSKKILIKLLQVEKATYDSLCKYLKLSKPTVSWYAQKLENDGLIVKNRKDKEIVISIINKNQIIEVLSVFKESFLDRLINKFMDTWER